MSYEDFKNLRDIKKDKLLSVFCSNKIFTAGHKVRFNFCEKLQKHFKDKLDWFGAGVRPVASKWDGVAPYKYHIALENSSSPDYWTEKLIDPLMVLSHPIYCGATNIRDYFSDQQVSVIDIRYPKTAIAKIEKLIEEDFYKKNFSELVKARDLAMDKYNSFNLIAEIVESDEKRRAYGQDVTKLIVIKQEEFFLQNSKKAEPKLHKNFLQRIKKSLGKKAAKITNSLVDQVLFIRFLFNS